MSKKILLIDDEKKISDIIAFNLKKEGYTVICAYDGVEGLTLAKSENPDLILLDIMMPKLDGLEVCKRIRKFSNTPIIMLTAKAEEFDIVVGLELGADDYITKPFSIREVMARVKATLRREIKSSKDDKDKENQNVFSFKDIYIDIDHYEVRKKNEVVELTLREYELFKFLALQKSQIFTREALLEKVWGYEYFGDVRTVDVTVRRLREKIEDNPSNPTYILTKRGVGYYFSG